MASKPRAIITRLKSKKDELLRSHGPRTPMDTKISHLIQQYQALDREDESVFLQARFDLCDLHLAKGEVLSALTELATASEFRLDRATTKAAEIMSRIHTKKYTRAIRTYDAGDIKGQVAIILRNAEDGFPKKRLQLYVSVYKKDMKTALIVAGDNIGENPRLGVPDFTALARSLAQRKTYMTFLPQLGKIINTHFQDIIDHGGRSLVQEFEEKFRDDPDALDALALDDAHKTPFDEFVRNCSFAELLNFINNSDAFLFADAMGEEQKDLLIDEFSSRALADTALPHKNMLVLLQKASCTYRFWSDPSWRMGFLSALKTRLTAEPDHHAHMALGIIAYQDGDDDAAKTHFSHSVEGDSPFAETGATSFMSTVVSTAMGQRLLNCSGITMDRSDFRDKSIVTCSDETYFKRYAIPYLQSLRRTGSTCPVHFHIAGNKIRLKDFVASIVDLGVISFSYETPPEKTPAYYASMRFLKAPYFVDKVASRVLLTDIDVSFRSDPEDLLDNCIATGSDVMFRVYDTVRIVNQASMLHRPLYRYPRTYPWAHVNAACLCLTDTAMGKVAATQIARDMADHLAGVLASGRRAWWVDQNALLFSYRGLLADKAVRIGNIENFGVPFGSFDYSDMRVVGGASPSLAPRSRQPRADPAPRTSVWSKAASVLSTARSLLDRRRA